MTYQGWITVAGVGYVLGAALVVIVGFTNLLLIAIVVGVVCLLAQGSGDRA